MSIELLNEIKQVVESYGIDPYFTYAVAMVESNGKGYRNNGFPTIRFEKHVFLRYLKKAKVSQQIIRKAECIKGSGWDAYQNALAIDEHYAKLSTSYGIFQIMGFNHSIVGYNTVKEFVEAMELSTEKQIEAFCMFVINTHIKRAINNKDFSSFAYTYNGPNYRMNNYDIKLESIYTSLVEGTIEETKSKKRKGYTQAKE